MPLSDVFKFTQGLGQKGHQIGRKVGDAIELLTLGMIHKEESLTRYLIVEDGVEGATTAKHKVEFSFYNLEEGKPSKKSADLFGIIECKKVGVEQTVKQNFKTWKARPENKVPFNETEGYNFTISPPKKDFKWLITVKPEQQEPNNICITTTKVIKDSEPVENIYKFSCESSHQILVTLDTQNELHVLGPENNLSELEHSIKKCVIIKIDGVANSQITKIHVNESLPGPQTPEKAKQASFVSLDVRKKVLGRFDKTDNDDFISILVIGEASHWEKKSRSMIKLCNDYNLIIPDKVLVYLFEKFEEAFGNGYQEMITKTHYKNSEEVRNIVSDLIEHFNNRILFEMGSDEFMQFEHFNDGAKNKVRLKPLTVEAQVSVPQ